MYTLRGKENVVFNVKVKNQFRRKEFFLVKYMIAKKDLFENNGLK